MRVNVKSHILSFGFWTEKRASEKSLSELSRNFVERNQTCWEVVKTALTDATERPRLLHYQFVAWALAISSALERVGKLIFHS